MTLTFVAFPLRSSISVPKNHEKSKLPKIPTFAPDFAMTFDQRSSIKSAIRVWFLCALGVICGKLIY
jgi:hypothetical protein